MRGKRLLKPYFQKDEDDYMECISDGTENNIDLSQGIIERSNKRYNQRKNKKVENLSCKSLGNESEKIGVSVLGTLINSLREKNETSESNLVSEKEEKEMIKTNKIGVRDNIKLRKKEKKHKNLEIVDMSNLLKKMDKIVVSKDNLNTRVNSQDNLKNMFDSFDAQGWCDNEYNFDNNLNNYGTTDVENDMINLTDLEKAMLPVIKEDYNSELSINEWLPSRFMELKSEVVRRLDDETIVIENKELCEFFYSQWIEQYNYMSTLTQDFNRDVHDCFVLNGQIPSVSTIKEFNPDLLLDPKDDKMPFTVQDLDGRVILSRLVYIANSQQKQIGEMNKANRCGASVDDYEFRKEYGVISKKAREKLWWLCRMAEHCGLIGREGKKMRYYLVQETGDEEGKVNSFIYANATINSSADITMEIFNQDINNSNENNLVEKSVSFSDKDLFNDEDNYEEYPLSQDLKDEDYLKDEPNQIDVKWSELSSLKISNRVRPWEKKKTESSVVQKSQEKAEKKDTTDSRIKLFKFMLKNIGPRPLWTMKSTSFEKVGRRTNKAGIEIEPPNDLSLREQGQLRIKWIQMRNQAEKLAIHHFKIIDPETKELYGDKLKYWSDLFNINLLIPNPDSPKIKRSGDDSNIKDMKTKEHNEVPIYNSLEDNIKHNSDNSIYESENISNFLPLDIEYVSEDENSDMLNNEIGSDKNANVSENNISVSENEEESKFIGNLDETNEGNSFVDIEEEDLEKASDDPFEGMQEREERHLEENLGDSIGENSERITDDENSDEYDQKVMKEKKEAYKRYITIRNNRRKLKKKMMEKYGHLLENEAEESDEDGVQFLKRGMEEEDSEDCDEDLDWDEISGFSDFIDDDKYNNELDGDAIQAHLKHMKQIEERQYRQLFTLEGLKERKNKIYGFLSEIQDDGVDGETRLEKKNNEIYNPVFFDDVVSEYWTDEEDYEYLSDEEINEKNMVDILGIDYDDWEKDNQKSEIKSSDESINLMRREKYIKLKNALLKEASSQIHLLKQRFHNLEEKMKEDISESEKASLREKYLVNADKLRMLLKSINNACNKCIYENHQYFDHIDISKYIQKRQENKLLKEKKNNNSHDSSEKTKARNNKINKIGNKSDILNYYDSEDELVTNYKLNKKNKNILNVRGARFIIENNNGNRK
ncbi:hypothetical protein RS030_91503 [Cryptosporidium xiaoi]|uniref:Uncharacterized protein n=1 Tax=Cryptosporidium xiaoi TaxID=659607 RepID=A0AAV9XSE7_9CRYT